MIIQILGIAAFIGLLAIVGRFLLSAPGLILVAGCILAYFLWKSGITQALISWLAAITT